MSTKLKTILPILFFALSLATVIHGVTMVRAQTANAEEIEEIEEKIEEYEKKISELQGKAKTLANEISSMDAQINLTQLKIQESTQKIAKTEQEIEELQENIEDLQGRISKLEKSIDHQQFVLGTRIREQYKNQEQSFFISIFGSTDFSSIVQKDAYLKTMGHQDDKLIDEMSATKKDFNNQKNLYEDKKEEEEKLRQKLVAEKANLDNYRYTLEKQKIEKDALLKATQNDESKYQDLLEEAKHELNQIIGAVSVLKGTDGEKVKKGDVIGRQGNTGYSSGSHLHFGVYKYSSFEEIDGWNWYYSNYVDPIKKLESKTVYWNTGCESAGNRTVGKGDWRWPMNSLTVSQGFGHTCWSNIYYGGKPHPALDMYAAHGSPVFAVDYGTAYTCRNCLNDGGNGVFLFHDDGYMTVYWHLQ